MSGVHIPRDETPVQRRFCAVWPGRSSRLKQLARDQSLRVDGYFGQSFDARPVLAESVLDDTEIEARDDDIIPVISDAAQGNVKHGDNLRSQWILAFQRDGAEEFLAFRISGIVRAGVGLLSS